MTEELGKKPLTKVRYITIDEGNEHQRLDNFLSYLHRNLPKGLIYKLIRKGNVRVNKGRVDASYKLQIDDIVRVPPVEIRQNTSKTPAAPHAGKKLTKLIQESILYDDDSLMVLNKPSGIAVHGGSGVSLGLIETLRDIYPNSKNLELVHRLDKDTSGCIIIAKKRSALRSLHEMIRNNQITKIYHTLVMGAPPNKFNTEYPLKKNQLKSGERIVTVDDVFGDRSLTKFKLLKQFKTSALLEARPITGRTHQIRVHAKAKGFPIAGDIKYGNKDFNLNIKKVGLKRLFLHAYKLQFKHPKTQELISVIAEYDKDLSGVIKLLSED